MMKKKINSDSIFGVVNGFILLLITLMIVYPLYFVIIASVSDPVAVNMGETLLLPKGINFLGYKKMLEYSNIVTGYKNSIIYTVVGTICNLLVCIPTAFVLSRKELPGRKWLSMFFVVTMYFQGGVVPTYLVVKQTHLLNTMWALIVPGVLNTYNMIVCRSFFANNVSEELFESTKIDGGGYMTFFFKVVLPLSTSIIAVMVLYHALVHWNSYLTSLYYIRDSEKYPLQLVLRSLTASLNVDSIQGSVDSQTISEMQKAQQSVRYAVVIASAIPVFLIYPFVQKHFVKGVMVGSVKG